MATKATLSNIILYALLGVVIFALSAQLRLEVPFGTNLIPITGQSLAVLVFALAVGTKTAFWATLLYVGFGGLGLGIFAGGTGGFEYLTGNTGGYLYGFIVAGIVVGLFSDAGWDQSFLKALLATLSGTFIILLFGYLHLAYRTDTQVATANGLNPILLKGAAIKAIIAATIWPMFHTLNRWHEKRYHQRFSN